jgi:hypothetical protein
VQLCLYYDASACVTTVTRLVMEKLTFTCYGHTVLWHHDIMETGDRRKGSAKLVLLLHKY